ncbi:hypothetical protein GCM10009565_05520 [Amycolatopsis albidoflavus]
MPRGAGWASALSWLGCAERHRVELGWPESRRSYADLRRGIPSKWGLRRRARSEQLCAEAPGHAPRHPDTPGLRRRARSEQLCAEAPGHAPRCPEQAGPAPPR